jgi:cytochrome c2
MRNNAVPSSLLWLAGMVTLAVGTAVIGGGTIYVETTRTARTQANAMTSGDWRQGRLAISRYGCGSCHVIPGIHGANGKVGPDLTHIGQRSEIAGTLSNDPQAMMRWLVHPQAIEPGNGMPEQGVTESDARNMAAYLYAQN